MVENTGRRNSIINRYSIEILELREKFDVQPREGNRMAQGRHGGVGFAQNQVLSQTGNINLEAESATAHGILLFFIDGLSLQRFVNADMTMHGNDRRFGPHCRLTLIDTQNSSATEDFELNED